MAIKTVNSKITKIVAEDIKAPANDMGGSILGTYTGKCCDSNVFNNNDMKLNRELFETLFDSEEYKRAMKYGHYLGFLGHPEDPGCQDYKNCCIVMRDCNIADNGDIIGTFDVLNTPVGQIVKTLKDAGIDLGISIRGAGDVAVDGEVDPETFVFRGFDLVTFPAYDDAIPEFQALAASTDVKKQVQYKKICSIINKNLHGLNISASNELQKNFTPDSDEYKKLEARKMEIGVDGNCPECEELSDEDKLDVIGKKLECMTDLYMEECQENDDLKSEIKSCKSELDSVKASYERKLKHLERITSSQQKLMQDRVVAANEKCGTAVKASRQLRSRLSASEDKLHQIITANSAIKQELNSLKKSNLIYKQKIECSDADIADRDITISDLRTKLDKTVMASTVANKKASDCGEEVSRLKSELSSSNKVISDLESKVTAMEDMLHDYQQAYADIYATAIGTSFSQLSVTASTSVRDLETMITGSTNTANIPVSPEYADDLTDDTNDVLLSDEEYGADLATL